MSGPEVLGFIVFLVLDEVAELFELSTQTVANHMSLAMADLRTALRPFLADGNSSKAEEDCKPEKRGSSDG